MNQNDVVENEELNNENTISTDSNEVKVEETVDKKKFITNISLVLISNIVSLLSGVLVGFIIPKIMGVSEYGYYRTFTLYSSYIGLLHFGFLDGIYLRYAGKKYEEIDKAKFRAYTRFLIIMEAMISAILIAVSFAFIKSDYYLIIIFVSLNVFVTNVTMYYEYICQLTMKFKRSTIRNIIKCSFDMISVVVLFLLYTFNDVVIYNYIYVIIVLSINYALLLWYFITYRELTLGKAAKFKEMIKDYLILFKVGIPLLLANLVAKLLFVADQQVVNVLFDNDTYSTYAFAYTLISLITVATGSISVVLFPTLKTLNKDSIATKYTAINAYLLIFVAFCLIVYFPLEVFIRNVLPEYYLSMATFLIIVPGVMISSSISVIKFNCYKLFDKINSYFIKSVIILALSVVANIVVYLIFKDTKSISMVSIGVLLVWYLVVEYYFIKEFKVKWLNNFIYMVVIIAGFYGATFIPNIYLAGVSYLGYFLVITAILYRSTALELLKRLRKVINR